MDMIKNIETKIGNFELYPLTIGEFVDLIDRQMKEQNSYDKGIENIVTRSKGKLKHADIYKMPGSVVNKLISSTKGFGNYDAEIKIFDELTNDEQKQFDAIVTFKDGQTYKFKERTGGELKRSGKEKDTVKLIISQILLSLCDPILDEKKFRELPENYFEAFTEVINKLYDYEELLGN